MGIKTRRQLQEIGPVAAFNRLVQSASEKPSLNFLYAMVGALEERHWSEVAKSEKARLLMELEDSRQLDELLRHAGDEKARDKG